MKKRLVTLAALLVLLPTLVFAEFSYALDILSFDPLYQEYTADRNRAGLDFQYLMLGKDDFPKGVYQNDPKVPGVKYFPFIKEDTFTGFRAQPFMGLIHLGETLGLLRHTFTFDSPISPISFDFSFQGQIDFGFEGEMADLIGYDGSFFYGATARFADLVSLRFGLHHVCSHMGDATGKLLGLDREESKRDEVGLDLENFRIFKKYIRMNAIAIGLSIEPVEWMRVYAEYNFLVPGITYAVDQTHFAPKWYADDKNENFVYGLDDSYRADIWNFGIEFSYPFFEKLGKTTIAYDCKAYEEGRIVYKIEDADKIPDGWNGAYDKSLPWEFEHGLVVCQEINDLVSFEIGFHHGRFPINTFYHQRATYGYIGGRLNFKSTVRAVDTAK